MNPMKAIRAKCLDCCGDSAHEVKACPCSACPLYPFRLGKNPYRKAREYSPEELVALKARLSQNRPTNTERKNTVATPEGSLSTRGKNL